MFQAIQLPTGIADLDSSLANVDWDTFTLKKRTSILPSTDFVRNFTYISRETINHSYLGRKQTSYYRYLTENTQKDQVIWSIDRVSKNDAHFPPPHARRQTTKYHVSTFWDLNLFSAANTFSKETQYLARNINDSATFQRYRDVNCVILRKGRSRPVQASPSRADALGFINFSGLSRWRYSQGLSPYHFEVWRSVSRSRGIIGSR